MAQTLQKVEACDFEECLGSQSGWSKEGEGGCLQYTDPVVQPSVPSVPLLPPDLQISWFLKSRYKAFTQ